MKKYTAPQHIRSYKNAFGGTDYYSGTKKIGSSYHNALGGTTNYDAKGNKIGTSYRGIGGTVNHYDNSGKKVGYSAPSIGGMTDHHDSNGNVVGFSGRDHKQPTSAPSSKPTANYDFKAMSNWTWKNPAYRNYCKSIWILCTPLVIIFCIVLYIIMS